MKDLPTDQLAHAFLAQERPKASNLKYLRKDVLVAVATELLHRDQKMGDLITQVENKMATLNKELEVYKSADASNQKQKENIIVAADKRFLEQENEMAHATQAQLDLNARYSIALEQIIKMAGIELPQLDYSDSES